MLIPVMGTEPGETYIAGISPPAPVGAYLVDLPKTSGKQVNVQTAPGYITSDSQHLPDPEIPGV